MARGVVRALSRLRGRARQGAGWAHRQPRRDGAVRGAPDRPLAGPHPRDYRGDRRGAARRGIGQGNHDREARLHRPRRRHRGAGGGDASAASGGRLMFPPALLERATALLDAYRTKGWRIATAESCTGGLVAGLLTEIGGSSDVVERGFVAYSNAAKTGLLGVPGELISAHGAV